MLRKGLADGVESGESSFEEAVTPTPEQATQRFEYYELLKGADGKPVELAVFDRRPGPPRTLKPRGSSASAVGEIQAARSVMNNSETDISCDRT
jgi:hypothetical protein